jgi:streptogramin lyase
MPGDFFIFDLDGNLLETWGTPGPGDGQFDLTDPQDGDAGAVLFAPDGSFFVADTFNARIQEFDKDRNFVRSWGTRGTGDGQFLAPVGMAFDAQGNLLISDVLRNNVQRFSPDGAFLGVFGGPGNGPGEFKSPLMITIAADGAVWIADGGNNRVQVFNPDGSFKFAIGQAGQDGSVNLNFPSQVAFDRDGNAFVTDQNNNLVRVFDSQGRFIYQFGGIGNGDGQFNAAGSIAIYRGTTVFVVDWHGNRLEKFKVVGPFPPPAAETPAA